MSWFVQDANKPKPKPKQEVPKEIEALLSHLNENEKPSSNMLWAVLATFFGFTFLGIAAIVKASQVDPKWEAGDREGARESADKAVKYAVYAVIIQFVGLAFVLFKYIFWD